MRPALRLGLLLIALAVPAGAQQQPEAQGATIQSPILVIEPDRLYNESAFGAQAARAIEEEGQTLATENRRIEAELTAEEKALTEKRGTVPAEQFRKLAEAFDDKVQKLRKEQDAKARALGNRSDEQRHTFLTLAEPVLGKLMRESGAAIILDKRSAFLTADVIDITDRAIARINAEIGVGEDPPVGDTPVDNETFPTGEPVPANP